MFKRLWQWYKGRPNSPTAEKKRRTVELKEMAAERALRRLSYLRLERREQCLPIAFPDRRLGS